MKSKYIRLTIEVLVWTGFIIFPLILFPTIQPYVDKGLINPATIGVIITHSLLILFYYFNYYYALPRYYFTRRYVVYFPLVLSYLLLLLLIMLSNKNFNPLPSPPFKYATLAFSISIVLRFIMMLLLSLGFASYNRLKRAEEEKLKSELSFLKAQINPHFLFNTLNSIYALAVKKSESTPESVTKLASIMRYVITDAASDLVPLNKEIDYVTSYIELEKLRLTQKVNFTYSLKGDFFGQHISPLIFIPLIENAFKHGISTTEASTIAIEIEMQSKTLKLNVKNTKVRPDKKNNNGLGIENVRKRLNLLYSGKHQLNISDEEKEYSVNLVISLND